MSDIHYVTANAHAFGLKLVTPPAVEPVSLGDLKARLRITTADEDTDLENMIRQAREMCEVAAERAFITQTWLMTMDDFPRHHVWKWQAIRLPRPPLQSVTWVKYYDVNGTLQTYDPTLYQIDTVGEPARIMPEWGAFWNFVQWGRPAAVQVQYVAGYGGTAASCPWAVSAAIMVTCAALRQNPALDAIPGAAKSFLDTLQTGEYR